MLGITVVTLVGTVCLLLVWRFVAEEMSARAGPRAVVTGAVVSVAGCLVSFIAFREAVHQRRHAETLTELKTMYVEYDRLEARVVEAHRRHEAEVADRPFEPPGFARPRWSATSEAAQAAAVKQIRAAMYLDDHFQPIRRRVFVGDEAIGIGYWWVGARNRGLARGDEGATRVPYTDWLLSGLFRPDGQSLVRATRFDPEAGVVMVCAEGSSVAEALALLNK